MELMINLCRLIILYFKTTLYINSLFLSEKKSYQVKTMARVGKWRNELGF